MSTEKTLLDELRSQSQVDCDTLDYKVAEALGPFVDCTSNQAIAYGELQKPENATLVNESIDLAKELHQKYAEEVSLEQLATEVTMVKLSSRIVKYLTGFAHIQTNPYQACSKVGTIANAERIVAIYKRVNPDFPSSRVCIKIPSTWEGIQACRELEKAGIHTLATTLFSMEQAALAADAGCTYIAPYVNELKRYYSKMDSKTQVLPASLISVAEVMKLAGVHHITVSPPLLAELASTPAALASATADNSPTTWFKNDDVDEAVNVDYESLVRDESAYRIAYTRSKGGANEKKLTDAINIFADMQDQLEEIIKAQLS